MKINNKTFLVGCLFVIFSSVSTTCQADKNTIEQVGTGVQLALPLTALTISLFKGDTTGIKQFAYASALAIGVTYILKPTINERRPDGGHWSFPSGHTMISFDASTYLWRRYGPSYGIPATALAAFVGYSRIESKRHYFHDVLAGAALGIVANLLFTSKYNIAVSAMPGGGAAVTLSKPL